MSERFIAELDSPESAVAAAELLRAEGHTKIDAFTPFSVHALEEALAIPRSRIPYVAFAAGAASCLLAYLVIWGTNAVDYPLVVGARPLDSLPADVPLLFESTVLLAGVVTFVLVFVRSGLPRLHHPIMEVDGFERVATNRFWLVVDPRDRIVEASTRARLITLGAVIVRDVPR